MKIRPMLFLLATMLAMLWLLLLTAQSSAQTTSQPQRQPDKPDPNFYIYLAFGQSNMAGGGRMDARDTPVDPRFQVLGDFDDARTGRKMGQWYDANPPLMQGTNGISICDYFGRTMVLNLPKNIRIGMVKCAVSGTKIELWDNDAFKGYLASLPADGQWKIPAANKYDNNPYQYLVKLAKIAQKSGVIKGFLVHQGESNFDDPDWPKKMKKIYDDLCRDLSLDPKETHLFAGEVVDKEHNGQKWQFNDILAKLPQTLPIGHPISAKGLPCNSDNLHFTADGQREFGRRYAVAALKVLGYEAKEPKEPWVREDGTVPPSMAAPAATSSGNTGTRGPGRAAAPTTAPGIAPSAQ